MMRTPVVLVAGNGDTAGVTAALMRTPGTVVVNHRFDGQVVRRRISNLQGDVVTTAELPLELVNGCVCCTTRNDLLPLLRRMHRRSDVTRVVIALAPDLEPEPVCDAIAQVTVAMVGDAEDAPAGRDVEITAVITTVDTSRWLDDALSPDDLPDGRTVAQVAVGQAEFADVLVLTDPDATSLAVLRRLAPRARTTVWNDRVEQCLQHLHPDARRGRARDPHDPLLAGQPPLHAEGSVCLLDFTADRPFHPGRLHAAVDTLLEGVVRTRGRLFMANRPDDVMAIESAGGGLLIECAGRWLAAMSPAELAAVDPQRRVLAEMGWHERFGDRGTAMTVLVCGADPVHVTRALSDALLTDAELDRPHDWADLPDPFEASPSEAKGADVESPGPQRGDSK